MLQHALRVLSTFAIVSAGGALVASDFDVVINEIHYNPASEVGDDEFLELYNRGGTEVDLSGWALSEGVSYVFPFGTTIPPKGYLVVSPNAVHSEARYRLDNVVGDWTGRLDNGGEIVALVSTAGDIISRVHYGDGGIWPSSPDGLGPSLEYGDPFGQIDVARHWHASARVDGSPGERNSGVSRTAVPTDEVVLIEQLRVPAGARCIELPAGLAGDEPGTEDEPFETAARRELLEETGYEAGRLEHLYEGVVSAGLTNESMTWFLATGCRKVGPGGGDDAEEIDVHVVPLADVLQWIEEQQHAGKTFDVKALSILDSWLKPRLEVP